MQTNKSCIMNLNKLYFLYIIFIKSYLKRAQKYVKSEGIIKLMGKLFL